MVSLLNLGYLSLISLVFLFSLFFFSCLHIVNISHKFILLFVILYL